MGKGIDGLVTPYTTSEFHAMVELLRGHHHAEYDQLVVLASDLQRQLGRIKGAPGLVGLDSKIAARRVVRPLKVAAGYNLKIGRAAVRSYDLLNELFLNPGRSASTHAKTFNINK